MAYKVFISSTYLDNKRRRKIVEDAIIGADMLPLGMERFAASENPIVDESELLATESDLYVGIVAHRYGTILDGHDFSITELEYRAAKAAGVPRLVFEIDPSLPVVTDTDFDHGMTVGTSRKSSQLFAPFIELINSRHSLQMKP